MPLKIIRVDDRLIHGQVVESWLPHFDIDRILVVSDELATDGVRKSIMRFATPDNVGLDILSVADAARFMEEMPELDENIMVLVPGLEEILELLKAKVRIEKLNIGGMHYSAGKNFHIGKAIFLSDRDSENLKSIWEYGVRIEGRGVPTDEPVDLIKAIGL